MTEYRTVLERAGSNAPPADLELERILRRRDRNQRNRRIAAGIVGVAVFVAAIWIVTTGGPFDRTQMPTVPGAATGPAETTVPGETTDPGEQQGTLPPHPVGIGLEGLPPRGATPSAPENGELVLRMWFGHTDGDFGRFQFHLFADGRVIWERWGLVGGSDANTGLIEQRLTPEGVQLVLTEALSSGLFDRDRDFGNVANLHYGGVQVRDGDRMVHLVWGDDGRATTTPTPEEIRALDSLDARLEDLSAWLPSGAWDDEELRAFVPARFSVCTGWSQAVQRSDIMGLLPPAAADMLGPLDSTRDSFPGPLGKVVYYCSVVSTEEARQLVRILDGAGASLEYAGDPTYRYSPPGSNDVAVIDFGPMLPGEA